MATSDEWREVAEQIADASVPERSPALPRLYRFAVEEARFALKSFPAAVREQVDDLVHDKLHEKLRSIVDAANPRAFFVTAIRNAAIDLLRRQRKLAPQEELDAAPPANDAVPAPDETASLRIEAMRVLATLDDRERQIFGAIAAGEDRDDIAAALGTSRANIDQIVSRARRRMGGGS
jgi:RNA polymerase sigma factor (sigma-70 family)